MERTRRLPILVYLFGKKHGKNYTFHASQYVCILFYIFILSEKFASTWFRIILVKTEYAISWFHTEWELT